MVYNNGLPIRNSSPLLWRKPPQHACRPLAVPLIVWGVLCTNTQRINMIQHTTTSSLPEMNWRILNAYKLQIHKNTMLLIVTILVAQSTTEPLNLSRIGLRHWMLQHVNPKFGIFQQHPVDEASISKITFWTSVGTNSGACFSDMLSWCILMILD